MNNFSIERDSINNYSKSTERTVLPVVNLVKTVPAERANIVYNFIDKSLYYSDGLDWIPLFGGHNSLTVSNEGGGAGIYDAVSSTPSSVILKSLIGSGGITVTENNDTVEISAGDAGDESFFVDKSGQQVIPATASFTYTTISNWFPGGIGRYNTGCFNETTGLFTALTAGKYHFDATVRFDNPSQDHTICLRIEDVSSGTPIVEKKIPSNITMGDSGISMSLSTDVQLQLNQTLELRAALVSALPLGDVSIASNLGETVFSGHLF